MRDKRLDFCKSPCQAWEKHANTGTFAFWKFPRDFTRIELQRAAEKFFLGGGINLSAYIGSPQ